MDLIYIRVLEQDTCDIIRTGPSYPILKSMDSIDKQTTQVINGYDKKLKWCGGWNKDNCRKYYKRIAIVDAKTLQSIREIY